MPQNHTTRKTNSQKTSKSLSPSSSKTSKSLHSRNCIVVPKSLPKANDNMREVSIKLMAIMKAKKECNVA